MLSKDIQKEIDKHLEKLNEDWYIRNVLKKHKGFIFFKSLYGEDYYTAEDIDWLVDRVYTRTVEYYKKYDGSERIFATYTIVNNKIGFILKDLNRKKKRGWRPGVAPADTVSYDSSISENYSRSLAEIIPSQNTDQSISKMWNFLYLSLQSLPSDILLIYCLHYFDGVSVDSVGKMFGYAKSTVSEKMTKYRKFLVEAVLQSAYLKSGGISYEV